MTLEHRPSSVLVEFARNLGTEFPTQAILDHLVVQMVDVLPVSAAGVTLISAAGEPRYVAASDDSALRFVKLQTEVGEGPCLTASNTGQSVSMPDLRRDDRYPRFVSRAVEEGVEAVFTFPRHHGHDQLGALDLYRSTPGPLDAEAMLAAQTLADVAAAYIINAQAHQDLEESSERSMELSLHDALTGLPNRTLLVQRLDHAILRGRRSEKLVAILFVDLDRFKSVNDTYGHRVGDELLAAVAERLTQVLRPGDTLARMAGDGFAILCEDLEDATQVEPLATRIDAALAGPFVLSGTEVLISASVGIDFAGRGDEVPEQVLQHADSAMYQAKREGGARHAIIDLREHHLAHHHASPGRDLRDAADREELRVEYQPIVAASDGRIIGAEALLRWTHPDHGAVAPATFIPLAERAGLVTEIGRWVLERACCDVRHWQRDGAPPLAIAVNVSVSQLTSPGFSGAVDAVLTQTRTDPTLVTLEVTESVFLQDSERALAAFRDLKDVGVRLALDDFGTGYSSLSYLKRFPFDVVKIDQSFVADLQREHASRLIAEGVESDGQHRAATALGCDSCQGFFFAPPSPADTIDAYWRGHASSVTLPLRTELPVGAGR